jgi:hypothetical protein
VLVEVGVLLFADLLLRAHPERVRLVDRLELGLLGRVLVLFAFGLALHAELDRIRDEVGVARDQLL